MKQEKILKKVEGRIDLRALTDYIAELIAGGAMLSSESQNNLRNTIQEKENKLNETR